VRWWDGAQWTEHTFQREPDAVAAAAAAGAVPAAAVPTGHTGPAVLAAPRVTKTYRGSGAIGRWALGTALLVAAIQAAVAFSVDSSFERVQQAVYAQEDLDSLMTAYDVLGLVLLAGLVLAWLVNAAWLARARSNAEALAPASPHQRRAGWAWGSWVCPLVSFWFPYQVVRDVSRATRPRGTALLGLWWAAFLGMLLFNRVSSSVVDDMLDSPDTEWADLVETVRNLEFTSFVITVLAAAIWIAVVRRIEGDQAAASAAQAV
jgi:hypothetical protein